MDTKKALVVVAILLILMNITLASYIVVINANNKKFASIEEYTVKILKQRDIGLNCLIPSDNPGASSITLGDMLYSETSINTLSEKTGGSYSFDEQERLIFTNSLSEEVVSGEMSRTTVERLAHNFIDSIGLQKNEYVLDFVIETGTDEYNVRYIYKDNAGNYYFDSYIEMNISNYGVISSEINALSIEKKNGDKGGGIPISAILLTNMVAESKAKVINGINYGYHRKNSDSNESVMCWRIRLGDGSEKYFDIETGKEITPELDILEFHNIVFNCQLPESFNGYDEVVYGLSTFTQQILSSTQVFLSGQTSIETNGTISFVRTTFGSNIQYSLNKETVAELSEAFINEIGLKSQNYYMETIEQVDDNLYKTLYIYKDSAKNLYFDNFIEIHVVELGVIFASIKNDVFEPGDRYSGTGISLGTILLNNLSMDMGQEYIISRITSGYIKTPEKGNTAIACWKVEFEDKSVRYFSAVTGDEKQLSE